MFLWIFIPEKNISQEYLMKQLFCCFAYIVICLIIIYFSCHSWLQWLAIYKTIPFNKNSLCTVLFTLQIKLHSSHFLNFILLMTECIEGLEICSNPIYFYVKTCYCLSYTGYLTSFSNENFWDYFFFYRQMIKISLNTSLIY